MKTFRTTPNELIEQRFEKIEDIIHQNKEHHFIRISKAFFAFYEITNDDVYKKISEDYYRAFETVLSKAMLSRVLSGYFDEVKYIRRLVILTSILEMVDLNKLILDILEQDIKVSKQFQERIDKHNEWIENWTKPFKKYYKQNG